MAPVHSFLCDEAIQLSAKNLVMLQAAMAEEDLKASDKEFEVKDSREMSYNVLLVWGRGLGV